MAFVNDHPATWNSDLLGFNNYITPLVELYNSNLIESPFTIGVFGEWGQGKSSFLEMLHNQLAEDKFFRVNFNPWYYRDEENILIPLLQTIRDQLLESNAEKFKSSTAKIANVLTRLGADILLKSITANNVSLKDIEEHETIYAKQKGFNNVSKKKKVRTDIQEVIEDIKEKGLKTVIFIDDLDRCTPENILDVLEVIKLFLDLEYVFVVLAVDKSLINKGVQLKYAEFDFDDDKQQSIGAEYLEKIIQLPITIVPLQQNKILDFIDKIDSNKQLSLPEIIEPDWLEPNPRKIKRIINILWYTKRLTQINKLDLKWELLVRMAILQVQAESLYDKMARRLDLFETFEAIADKPDLISSEKAFSSKFSGRKVEMFEFCCANFTRYKFLKPMFKGRPFKAEAENIQHYFSLISG